MSRQIKFTYELLNRDNIPIGELEVINGSVSLNSLAQIKRTARFTVKENHLKDVDYLNDRIRPVITIDGDKHPMGIYLIPSPSRSKTESGIIREIEAYDTTQILLEDKILDRYYIKKGTNYVKAITQLIGSAYIHQSQITPAEYALKRDREFEAGASKLSIVNDLLKEINYTSIYADNNGNLKATKYILPNLKEIDYIYKDEGDNPQQLKVINSTIDELDLFNVPNIFVVVASNAENQALRAVEKNTNPTSPLSIQSRKRNIVDYRTVSDIADQATLNAYAKRIAYEASNKYQKVQFSTIINPKHGYNNIVYIQDEKLGINDKFVETSWEIPLKLGATMTHNARRIIQL